MGWPLGEAETRFTFGGYLPWPLLTLKYLNLWSKIFSISCYNSLKVAGSGVHQSLLCGPRTDLLEWAKEATLKGVGIVWVLLVAVR